MAEKIFTSDERKEYEELAHRRGFKSLRKYLRSLIQQDAEQHGETVTQADDNLIDPIESFKQGWADVREGRVLTEEEFWKAVSDDE